jgi:hypothetical protein
MAKHFAKFSNRIAHWAGHYVTFSLACFVFLVWAVTSPQFGFSVTCQLLGGGRPMRLSLAFRPSEIFRRCSSDSVRPFRSSLSFCLDASGIFVPRLPCLLT